MKDEYGDIEEWEAEALIFDEQNWSKLVEFRRRKAENDPNIQHSLVDALVAIGKDETAFDWIIKPEVLRLDKDTLDYCYNYLRTKRKPRTVHELYLECCFSMENN